MDSKTAFAESQLKSLVQRIERLEEEKKALAGDIKEVYAEAKSQGFDTKILRKVIALRKMDANERAEQEAHIDLYMGALGALRDTPLGEAAIKRDFGGLGKPVPPTAAEKAKGVVAAFEKNGNRVSIAVPSLTVAEAAEARENTSAGDDPASMRSSAAEEARAAHNREVGGSTPPSATKPEQDHADGLPGPEESREDALPATEPQAPQAPAERLSEAETAAPTPTASDASLPGHASIAGAGEAGDTSPSASPTITDEELEIPYGLDRRNWKDGHPHAEAA